MTSVLFSPIELRGLRLANRIVVSPMCQYASQDGSFTDWHIMHLGQYAMGAAGLVMAEATAVSPEGRITPRCAGLYSEANETAMKRVIEFCRDYGVTALALQLAHAGRKASTHPPGSGSQSLLPEEGAWQTVAPSALAFAPDWHLPRAAEAADLERIKADFVAAVARAQRIGYDLIEIHAAHGYLLHEFLSPISNRREDDYGGSLENRMRLPLEVFAAVRAAWPDHKPLGVRVSASDWVEGGWTPEETVVFAGELQKLGCDFLDVSSGGLDPRQEIPLVPGYQVPFAEKVKRETGLTTMAVGLIAEPGHAEQIVASGQADMVAMARAMMYDPRWAWHAAEALGAETAYAPQYARGHPKLRPQLFPHRRAAE
jgi:2,4-dienoyl-CoA reductase-like NADH-dependent reductase (Old Yellow Enzyme family)